MDLAMVFGLLELPFLLFAVLFCFKTATALKGGKLGFGMMLVAWGFLVMAIGHLHLQLVGLFDFDLFSTIAGSPGGSILWFVALMVTWGLTGVGFYNIYKASSAA